MKTKRMEYETPAVYEHVLSVEGVLCASNPDMLDNDMEGYEIPEFEIF